MGEHLEELIGVPAELQRLLIEERPVDCNATLAAQGIPDDAVITVVALPSRYGFIIDPTLEGKPITHYRGKAFEYGTCVRTIHEAGTMKPQVTRHRCEVISGPPNFGIVIGRFEDFDEDELEYFDEEDKAAVAILYYPKQDFKERESGQFVSIGPFKDSIHMCALE